MMSKDEVTITEADVEAYVRAPFVRMLVPDEEEGGFVAEVLELPGCISEGETPEEAYRNLDDALRGWVLASLKQRKPIPAPVGEREYSGHFALRMPSELHRSAALRATQEGASLNQWIVAAIAARLSGEDVADRVVQRLMGRVSIEAFAGLRFSLSGPDKPGMTARWSGLGDVLVPAHAFEEQAAPLGLTAPQSIGERG